MMTVFNMEDGSVELENVDILAIKDEFFHPLPSLQLLTVAESESVSRQPRHHLVLPPG
ncbi:hypothetical protein [Janthinobacterium sp. B9-8]|uniref:hypothetical protein n=1 Tax=Janthinobacterium sp. B9-8 TaxID=1236179 RepID=UPI0012E36227|nr:hypothetical protein [Janthinobacterium sp. B9-8]